QFPAHHGIFANRWFDRSLLTTRNYETAATMGLTNDDLLAPTIYEILEDRICAVVGMQVNRGSQIRFVTTAGDGGLPAGIAWKLGQHRRVDRIMVGSLESVAADSRLVGRWPDLTLVYLPAVDAIGHSEGTGSGAYRETIRSLDATIGDALRVLDEAGLLERMTVVMLAEHGLVDVAPDATADLDGWLQGTLGIPTYFENTAGDRDADAPFSDRLRLFRGFRIVALHDGERYASLHLQPSGGWAARPTLDEILAFHRHATGQRSALEDLTFPEALVRHPRVAFAVARASSDEAWIWGKHGVGTITRRRSEEGAAYAYRVRSGEDPLGYATDPAARALSDGSFHRTREWLDASAALPRPDLVPLLGEAFESPRAGDVLLFAEPGCAFSNDLFGGHGGLTRDEMTIPMVFAGPGLARGGTVRAARLADLVPTLLDLMEWRESATRRHRFDGASIAGELRAAVASASGDD
ncbi:MAG TPA: alkaline phosphatase family protein, partial [Planctomycetota bacterium]|nr:alkaline phosphatase family protein [Planctomycetota bacterium]